MITFLDTYTYKEIHIYTSEYYIFRPMPLGKFFFIRHAATGLILEIERGREKPCCAVTTGYQLPVTQAREHQLWYFDAPTSTIRCQHNNFAIDLRGIA